MQEKIITGLICALCFTKHQHKEARAFTCRHVHCHRQKTWMKGGPPLTQSARHQLASMCALKLGCFPGPSESACTCAGLCSGSESGPGHGRHALSWEEKSQQQKLDRISHSGHSKLPSPASEAVWVLTCAVASTELAVILRPWGLFIATWGFPSSSAGKESACNRGDPGSIPGLGRPAGEGIGYPLQSSWASLMAQLVKNLPAMQETWVWSLGWEDPLEKGTATHSNILAWRILWTV